jgi:hypothetical protein
VLLSPGHLGPAFDAFLNVRVQPARQFSLSLFALAPVLASQLERSEGNYAQRSIAIGATADLHVLARPLLLTVGIGGTALISFIHPSLNADSEPTFVARDSVKRTAAILARTQLALPLTAGVRLSARVAIGMTVPELKLLFQGNEIASWGRPFVAATLGVELALPGSR